MPEVITQRAVDRMLEDGTRRDVAGARVTALYLRASQNGASWRVRSWRDGKAGRCVIGKPPEMSLSDARTFATAAVSRLKQGFELTPRWLEQQRIALGLQDEITPVVPVGGQGEDLDVGRSGHRVPRHDRSAAQARDPTELQDIIGNPVFKPLAGRAVADIERPMVSAIVNRVGTDRPAMAEAMVRALKRLRGWLVVGNQAERSGLTSHVLLNHKAPDRAWNQKPGHTVRVPTLQVCGEIVAACRSGVLHPTVARALEVVVLTCQRRETVASAETAEIDGKAAVWSIGAADMSCR